MRSTGRNLRVGVMVLVAVLILVYLTYNLKGWQLGNVYSLFIKFDFISGLEIGAPVRLAGYQVGEVRGIELLPKERKAQVEVSIAEEHQLPRGTRARIETSGIMGEKYIELSYGQGPMFLVDGDVIDGEEPFQIQDAVTKGQVIAEEVGELVHSLNLMLGDEEARDSLHNMVKNLSSLSESLSLLLSEEEGNIRTIVGELASVSEKLTTTVDGVEKTVSAVAEVVTGNKDEVNSTVKNMQEFSSFLKEEGNEMAEHLFAVLEKVDRVGTRLDQIGQNLDELLTDTTPDVREIVSSVKLSSENLNKASESAKQILQDVQNRRGVLGRLIVDEQLGEKVETGIEQITGTVDSWHRLIGSAFLRYRFRGYEHSEGLGLHEDNNHFRNDLTLHLDLNQRVFVDVGGNDLGGENDLELMFGSRFDRLALRAGVKDSESALGIDFALLRDRLDLMLEGIGFTDHDEQRLDVIGRFRFNTMLSLIGGVQDIGDGNNANLGLELQY